MLDPNTNLYSVETDDGSKMYSMLETTRNPHSGIRYIVHCEGMQYFYASDKADAERQIRAAYRDGDDDE